MHVLCKHIYIRTYTCVYVDVCIGLCMNLMHVSKMPLPSKVESKVRSMWHLRWLLSTRADISLRPSGSVRPKIDIKLRPSTLVRTETDIKLQPIGFVITYKVIQGLMQEQIYMQIF